MADSPAQLVELSAQALNAQRWAQAGALAQSARSLAEQSNDAPLAERATGFEELARIAPGLNSNYVMLMSLQLRGEYRGESLKELVRKDPGGATVLEARLNDAPMLKKKFGIELSTEHQETARSGGTSLAAAGGGGLVMFIIIARIVLRMTDVAARHSSPDGFDINSIDQHALEQALQQQKYAYELPAPRKAVAPQTKVLWRFPKKHDVPDAWNLVDDLHLLDHRQLVLADAEGDPFELMSGGARYSALESVPLAPNEPVSTAVYALPADAKLVSACREEACTEAIDFAKSDAVIGFPPNAKRRALGTLELGKSDADGDELIALMVEERAAPPDFAEVPWVAIKREGQLFPSVTPPFFLEGHDLIDGAQAKPPATRVIFALFELEPGDQRPKQLAINGQVLDLPAKPQLALSQDLRDQLTARGKRSR